MFKISGKLICDQTFRLITPNQTHFQGLSLNRLESKTQFHSLMKLKYQSRKYIRQTSHSQFHVGHKLPPKVSI